MTFLQIVAIALGGACGAVLRGAAAHWLEADFPWSTLLVNVVGSLAIGFIFGLEATHLHLHPHLRIFLTTGLCGALTTFSTFSYQTLALINEGRFGEAALNTVLNLALTLGAVWLGLRSARIAFG